MPPGFDRFESFGHDELTAKHCYFRFSRPPDVDGIKIFDNTRQFFILSSQRAQICYTGRIISIPILSPLTRSP